MLTGGADEWEEKKKKGGRRGPSESVSKNACLYSDPQGERDFFCRKGGKRNGGPGKKLRPCLLMKKGVGGEKGRTSSIIIAPTSIKNRRKREPILGSATSRIFGDRATLSPEEKQLEKGEEASRWKEIEELTFLERRKQQKRKGENL